MSDPTQSLLGCATLDAEPGPGSAEQQALSVQSSKRIALAFGLATTGFQYALAAAVCVGALIWLFKLYQLDLSLPFLGDGDGVFVPALVKGMMDRGWYFHLRDLGAPFELYLHDFPIPDVLHMLIMKYMAQINRDPILTVNLYFLLTYVLTTLTSLFVLRRLGVGYLLALGMSLLYAFAPYHWMRLPHPFLAAYYMIPLGLWIALRIYQGEGPFVRVRAAADERRWHPLGGFSIAATAIALLTGMAGAYYAFFTCFFLIVAGLLGCLRLRSASCLASACLVCVLIGGSLGACMWPGIHYQRKHGPNPHVGHRLPVEADCAPLRISQIILPELFHRIPALSKMHWTYCETFRPYVSENETTTFGIVGAAGFVLLLGWLIWHRREGSLAPLLTGLAALNLAALVLATSGGMGCLFNLYVSPAIRAYNRISIFMHFCSLAALALVGQALVQRFAVTWLRKGMCIVALAGVVVLGLLDQSWADFPPMDVKKGRMDSDRAYVAAIEEVAPPRGMIYQKPYVSFPEGHFVNKVHSYDHFWPYLYSHQLRWSFPVMRGREPILWAEGVNAMPIEQQVARLAEDGFSGIHIDRNGYLDNGKELEGQLARLLHVKPVISEDGHYSFFSLQGYTPGRVADGGVRGKSASPTGVDSTRR